MSEAADGRLDGLDFLIVQAQDRRVGQMLHIASLLADGDDVAEAENGLQQIEELLVEMKEHRTCFARQ